MDGGYTTHYDSIDGYALFTIFGDLSCLIHQNSVGQYDRHGTVGSYSVGHIDRHGS